MQNCDYESESINKPISYSLINTELPNVDSTTSRAHTREGQALTDGDPGLAAAFDLYFDKIDPSPTPTSMELLTGYVEELGGDVVCRAINEAIDQGERRWSYIHGILKNYCADGVKSLDDVERREARHERRKRRGGNDNAQRDISSGGGGPDIVYAVDGGGAAGTLDLAAVYNEQPGDLTGVDCPVCRNKGYVARLDEHAEALSSRPASARCSAGQVRGSRKAASAHSWNAARLRHTALRRRGSGRRCPARGPSRPTR